MCGSIFSFSVYESSLSYLFYMICCSFAVAAEQKARSTYEYLIDLAEDPDVLAPLRFLREREVVHFQRFGEALEIARDHLHHKHWFFQNK